MNRMELHIFRSIRARECGNNHVWKLSFLGLLRLNPLFLKTPYVISEIWYFKEQMQNLTIYINELFSVKSNMNILLYNLCSSFQRT